MGGFDRIEFQRLAAALIGAMIVATACIGAAVAPAAAAAHCVMTDYAQISQFSDLANA